MPARLLTRMRLARLIVAVGLMAAGSTALRAQSGTDLRVKAAAESIVAAELMADVSFLASDALRGRATPSPGLDTAADFVIRRLVQLGVRPMGDSGTYRQHYHVASSLLDTVRTRSAFGDTQLRWGDDFLVTQMQEPNVVTGRVVYVGNGLRSVARGIDAYAGVDVRGKWLMLHAGQAFSRSSPDTLGIYGVDYTSVRDEARRRGARGLLLIATRDEVTNWLAIRARLPRVRDLSPSVGRAGTPFPLPVVLLAPSSVALLLRGEGARGAAVLAADSAGRAAQSFVFRARRDFTLDLAGSTERRAAYNIVGMIDGADTTLRHEWISVSTHLDGAVSTRVAANGDSIYNAADDNGTGSAGNLSIARALMRGPRPRRPVLLIWDTGEETGLTGTRFLAYGPLSRRIVAHFTVDMIGRTRVPGTAIEGQAELTGPGEVFVSGPGVLSTVLDSALASVTRDYPYVRFDRRYEDPSHEFFYPRTDAAPYIEQGIPYMEFFTGLHEDYHQPSDEVAQLDPMKFEAVARSVYATLWTVANGARRPRIDKPVPPVLWFMTPR